MILDSFYKVITEIFINNIINIIYINHLEKIGKNI